MCEDKEPIYKMLACLMIEHLPATVWDTDTLVTRAAIVDHESQKLIHPQFLNFTTRYMLYRWGTDMVIGVDWTAAFYDMPFYVGLFCASSM